MIAQPFDFVAPETVDDALAELAAREGAKLLAGGMSLVPAMNLGIAAPEAVVSLNRVAGLDAIVEEDGAVRIGATARHRDVAAHPAIARQLPALAAAAASIGDVQVRNRGTIGGSCAHADPAADYLPPLAALGASLVLRGPRGERAVPADEFFLDIMRTSLAEDELLTSVVVPKRPGTRSAYRKLARVEGAYAIVNAAAVVDGAGATVAIGSVAGAPVLVRVEGEGEALPEQAAALAFELCADAFGDLSGGGDYRRAMAAVYARRAVGAAARAEAA